MTPLFTVIIPLYKAERFVAPAIEQLLRQKTGDYEIILVDDGSPDAAFEIASAYAKQHDSVLVLQQENRGPGLARNKALSIARGEYVLFLDADDVYSEDLLQSLAGYVREDKPDVVVYSYVEKNLLARYECVCRYKPARANSNKEIRQLYSRCFMGLPFNNGFTWNRAYRREFLQDNNIRFSEQRMQEDELFNLTVYGHAQSMVVVPDVLYTYIIHNHNSIFRFNASLFWDYCRVYEAMSELYACWALDTPQAIKYQTGRHYNAVINSLRNLVLNPRQKAAYTVSDVLNHCSTQEVLAQIRANSWGGTFKYYKYLNNRSLRSLSLRLKLERYNTVLRYRLHALGRALRSGQQHS